MSLSSNRTAESDADTRVGRESHWSRRLVATRPSLLGFASRLARDHASAEDLVQETILTALQKADRYDCKRPLRPWLFGILLRHWRYGCRRQAQRINELGIDLNIVSYTPNRNGQWNWIDDLEITIDGTLWQDLPVT